MRKRKRRSRPWGRGSVFPRDDGRWGYSWQKDGKKYQGSEATEAEAEATLDAIIDGVASGTPDRVNQTVNDWMEEWLSRYVSRRGQRTQDAYAVIYTRYIKSHAEGKKLRQVNRAWVSDLMAGVETMRTSRGKPLSGRYVRQVHAVLCGALSKAEELGRIPKNPALRFKDMPQAEEFEIHPLDEEETARFLEAAAGHDYGLPFALGLMMGLRASEVCRLETGHLLADEGVLKVMGTKTKGSRRELSVPSKLLPALCAHRDAILARRGAAGEEWRAGDLLFPARSGVPLNKNLLLKYLKQFLSTHGFRDIRFHDLRHSYASLQLMRGVPVHVVSEALGHSGPAITLKVYAHVLKRQKRQSADVMDGFIGGESFRVLHRNATWEGKKADFTPDED